MVNNQNIEQAVGIQMALMTLEIDLKKEHFIEKYDHILSYWFAHSERLLGWQCAHVSQDIRTEKETIFVNSQNIKQTISIQLFFILEIKVQKGYYFGKIWSFFQLLTIYFEPLLRWECAYACHDLRTETECIYDK